MKGTAMELLDRYLQAVGFWLPKGQRPDILAELSEEFRSQVEAREEELGRGLSEEEVEQMLQRWGNPLRLAERYLPARYLIGPAFYPLYLLVLKVYLWVWVVPWLAVWVGYVAFSSGYRAAHPGQALVHTLSPLIFSTACLLLFTTLAFAILERSQSTARILDRWNPRALPAPPDPDRISRASSLWGVVWNAVLALWWLGWLRLPTEPGTRVLVTARVEQVFQWPVLVLLVGLVAVAAVDLVRPWWTRPRAAAHLALESLGVLLASAALALGPWLRVVAPGRIVAGAMVEHWLNTAVLVSLCLIAIGFAARAVRDARRLLGKPPVQHWALRMVGGE